MRFIPCQLASPAGVLPVGDDWIFEPKFDGYRCQLVVWDGKLRLFTRNGLDWTERLGRSLPESVCETLDCAVDGEICALDKDGRPDFGLLCKALSDKNMPLAYFAFDLLACSGERITSLPLHARKKQLAEVIPSLGIESVKLVAHTSDGNALAKILLSKRWEGVMAKERNSPYEPGARSPAWRKLKFTRRQEFIVAAWRADKKTGALKSIMVATMDNGALTLRGSVGTGFSVRQRRELADFFSEHSPLGAPSTQLPVKGDIRFLPPTLIAEVEFLEFSSSGRVRGASFIGLREDKAAEDVQHETFFSDTTEKIAQPLAA
ncbi:non-homologous end-joining DNA ligase [Mesorhizobium sp. CO1-1-9]|uniref:non-homologous end-joining DNA ligase n=1 Tax=Mesorhizobium sp. CO1-1-9 TaxID=2876630 RepID=UPI001CCE60FE|nr:non-homologous end-joining DNA ligase [Mesorhizobium sp. CO1-1-9]MBZ9694887.1 non-homologous end-joining DNA ligase [Mesorhizobium sp. CO1-1-9]